MKITEEMRKKFQNAADWAQAIPIEHLEREGLFGSDLKLVDILDPGGKMAGRRTNRAKLIYVPRSKSIRFKHNLINWDSLSLDMMREISDAILSELRDDFPSIPEDAVVQAGPFYDHNYGTVCYEVAHSSYPEIKDGDVLHVMVYPEPDSD